MDTSCDVIVIYCVIKAVSRTIANRVIVTSLKFKKKRKLALKTL